MMPSLSPLPTASLVVDGIPCYTPERSGVGQDYPLDAFARLFAIEDRSFWFRGRNRILRLLLKRYQKASGCRFLEVGCGTGFVLQMVAEAFPTWETCGTDLHLEALRFARLRNARIRLFQADIVKFPLHDWCNVLGLFDVIEHIEDDVRFLQAACALLCPGGLLVVSVPQHPWLWSDYDSKGGHKRRYTRKELRRKMESLELKILHTTSFVTFLLPVLASARSLRCGPKGTRGSTSFHDLRPGSLLNAVGEMAMLLDETLIRLGLSLPWGGSLVVIARKQG